MKRGQILWLLGITLLLVACEEQTPTADQRQQAQTARAMAEADRQIGMPAIVNFQERRFMKMILELRDQEDLVCYAYLTSLDGTIGQFLGKCVGYGLPYSVQYTNPERLQKGGGTSSYWALTVPQPDPNGLFMPEGLSATWLMLIDPTSGEPRPVYVEPEIVVSPFPLHK